MARSTLYRRRQPVTPKPKRRPRPHRALDETEREEVLGALHCERFVDKAPAQVWATLLDEGTYLCSDSHDVSDFGGARRGPRGFPPLPSSIPSCHDWISGVALTSTFAQTRRPYKASLSLGAAVSLRLPSHTPSRERSVQALAGSGLMQLPTIYGCLQLAPYGTCTRRHSSMPGAHSRPTGSFRSRRGLSLYQHTHALILLHPLH